MLLLLLVASVPVIGIAGANAVLSYEGELATGRRDAGIFRQVAAERHGALVSDLRELLQGIARSSQILAAPTERCNIRMAMLLDIHRERYAGLWLLDAGGRVLCSSQPGGETAGTPDFSTSSILALAREEATRHSAEAPPGTPAGFVLDGFSQDPRGTGTLLAGAVPVLREGRLERVVVASLMLEAFSRNESQHRRPVTQRLWLVDRAGLPQPLAEAATEATLPSEALLRQFAARPAADTAESRSRGGQDYAYAISAGEQDLRLLVGVPTGELHRAANTLLLRRVAELAAFLLACLVVIVVGADIAIARPLRKLATRVREWRPGVPFGGQPLHGEPEEVRELELAFVDAAVVIAAREAELRAALHQRDVLMAEIHHRVKNNLQIVASLLTLQARRMRDPVARAEFSTARDRVQALATLHRHLYTNRTFEAIALRSFLEELCDQLFSTLGETRDQRIRLVVQADEMEIVTDQAVSLSLLVTEAVTNSIKHAFPGGRAGTITIAVALKARPEEEEDEEDEAEKEGEKLDVLLTIRDDGNGMEQGGSRDKGIGMTLIEGFAQHLGGEIERHDVAGGGTELNLRFPLRRRAGDIAGRAMRVNQPA